MEVDILEFRVPVDSNKTVFVWDIPPVLTQDQVYEQLFHVFSSFGPIYLLKVCPNAPLHPPGFYAIAKFYSAAHAASAQRRTDGRPLLHNSTLKVKLSSKQAPHFLSGRNTPLSHARCLELANHCLGFNGWTSDIITLKELSNEEDGEDEGGVRRRMRFGCMMKLSFPQHGVATRGAAVVEETFTCTGNGKVMVELKQTSDQSEAEETDDVLQVNEFPLSEPDEEEAEEEDWDLTVS
ncbi:RAD52 motif-containing protein 1 isoform 2-T5 [Anableps anableps]